MLVKFCTQHFMVHAERNVRNLDGSSPDHNPVVDVALDRVWKIYHGRKRLTPLFTSIMEKRFDQLFGAVTGCAGIGRFLERLTANKNEPLRFLYRSGAPLRSIQIECNSNPSHALGTHVRNPVRGRAICVTRDDERKLSFTLAGFWQALVLVCFLVLVVSWPPRSTANEHAPCNGVTPLRIVNLSPFHLAYGIPGSHGSCILGQGGSKATMSSDVVSHMVSAQSETEQMLADGETYRQSVTLRQGMGNGWEALFEASAVSHARGVFDGFIQDWHSFFGLPQGGRDTAPHNRLAFTYVRNGRTLVDLDDSVSSTGGIMVGLSRKLERNYLQNDGLVLRGAIRFPTGKEDALAGPGDLSASIWAETSGQLFRPRSGGSRTWSYGSTLGIQVASPPAALAGIGERVIAFGRLGVTWALLDRLSLTAQLDVNSTPYSGSSLAPLTGPVVMLGFGGVYKLSPHTAIEIAVSEDDGVRHAAADFGVHVTFHWEQ